VLTLGGKVTRDHRHYLLQTYDDVFEVVCKAYDFIVRPPRADPGASSYGVPSA
jgi:hypothetical protein